MFRYYLPCSTFSHGSLITHIQSHFMYIWTMDACMPHTYTQQKCTQCPLIFTQIECTHDSHISKYYSNMHNILSNACMMFIKYYMFSQKQIFKQPQVWPNCACYYIKNKQKFRAENSGPGNPRPAVLDIPIFL